MQDSCISYCWCMLHTDFSPLLIRRIQLYNLQLYNNDTVVVSFFLKRREDFDHGKCPESNYQI